MRIGLVGRMHSGKGEVASHLVIAHGFHKLAFADPVKDASVAAINAALAAIGRDPVMDRATLERDKAALRLMPQFIGTELGRQYVGPPTIWIDMLLANVTALDPDVNVVVDDCRFPNEAEALASAGFTLIHVDRGPGRIASIRASINAANPGLSGAEAVAKLDQAMNHPSETEVGRILRHRRLRILPVPNYGTIADLRREVDALLASNLMKDQAA